MANPDSTIKAGDVKHKTAKRPPPDSQAAIDANRGIVLPTQRTNIFLWFSAVICCLLTVLIIIGGLVLLIVYLVFHPTTIPSLDVETARINRISLDQYSYVMNSEIIFLAKFTNSNDKIDVEFEYINLKLYFDDQVVSTQLLEPFGQRRGDWNLTVFRMISTAVELTPRAGQLLMIQASRNDIAYRLEGALRTRARLGRLTHVSYWLQARCQLYFTSPPNGTMVRHHCKTRWRS